MDPHVLIQDYALNEPQQKGLILHEIRPMDNYLSPEEMENRQHEEQQGIQEKQREGLLKGKLFIEGDIQIQDLIREDYTDADSMPGTMEPVWDHRMPQGRLDKKKAKEKREQLVKRREKEVGLPLGNMGMFKAIKESEWGQEKWLKEKHGGITNEGILKEIKDGNHSHFEKLDNLFRDALAMKTMMKFNNEYLDGYTPRQNVKKAATDDKVQVIVNRLEEENRFFDPVLRLGLSQFANLEKKLHGEEFRSIYREIDNEIAKRIMVRTLVYKMSPTEEQKYCERIRKRNPKIENPEEELVRQQKVEKAKRAQMAKQLFMMQLGTVSLYKDLKDGDTVVEKNVCLGPVQVPVASVLAHCSRTLITTPRTHNEQQEDQLWDSILLHHNVDGTYTNTADIFERGGATHSLKRRRVGEQEQIAKEEKWKPTNLVGQTGMNVAIGGMGSPGVDDRIIDQDGTCGHVYAKHKRSEDGKLGAYLFGYESDAHKKTNQLGHTHTMAATPEQASSFLCHRTDEIGNKYGGRQADLSRMRPETLIACMNKIDEVFDSFNHESLRSICDKLAGKLLDYNGFINLLNEMGFEEGMVLDIMSQIREEVEMQ